MNPAASESAPATHVAVCIVAFRNPDDILACLRALERSTYTDFEVVICENGGPAAYEALTAVLPAALPGGQAVRAVLAPGNLGYAGGVNVCLKAAAGAGAWWVLNPDTEPGADALRIMLQRLAAGDCDMVGATVHSADGLVESRAGRWWPWVARAEAVGYGERLQDPARASEIERQASFVSGCCMLVSRRFLETVGPMREDFFLYCEEVEWGLRGLERGMHIGYAPDALVLHHRGTTTGTSNDVRSYPKQPVYLDHRNKILLTRDLYPGRFAIVALASLAWMFVRYGKRRAWRQLGYGVQGWFAGVLNRRGAPAWMRAS